MLMLELSLWFGLVDIAGSAMVIGIERRLEITKRIFEP